MPCYRTFGGIRNFFCKESALVPKAPFCPDPHLPHRGRKGMVVSQNSIPPQPIRLDL